MKKIVLVVTLLIIVSGIASAAVGISSAPKKMQMRSVRI